MYGRRFRPIAIVNYRARVWRAPTSQVSPRSLSDAAQRGRFPALSDRHDLWRLLFQITAQKAIDYKRHERRQKRGGGVVRGESALGQAGEAMGPQAMAQLIGDEPTPSFVAMIVEQIQELLDRLTNADVRAVAELKMEGYTNGEIAEKLGCAQRTVERRLHLIRKILEQLA